MKNEHENAQAEYINQEENMYFLFRKESCFSRETAAKKLGISPESLGNYERGETKTPAYVVRKMASLYNKPELRNYYCRTECALGSIDTPDLTSGQQGIERITLKLLNSFKDIASTKEKLIAIAADGIISQDEQPDFNIILDSLDTISKHIMELRIWAEKELRLKVIK